jgi:hypothetical protein
LPPPLLEQASTAKVAERKRERVERGTNPPRKITLSIGRGRSRIRIPSEYTRQNSKSLIAAVGQDQEQGDGKDPMLDASRDHRVR